MSKEAMKLALEVIQDYRDEYGPWCDDSGAEYAIKALEEALAKQEQPKARTGNCLLTGVCASEGHKIQAKQEQGEPVAWCVTFNGGFTGNIFENKRLADLCKRNLDAKYGSEDVRKIVPIYTTPQQPVIDKSAAIRIATALGWTPPKQEQGEPVAWMYDWISDEGEFIQDWTTSMAETLRDTGKTVITNVRPLYLTPKVIHRPLQHLGEIPMAWCRWSEDLGKWMYTHRQPTEELAWIPLYDHPLSKTMAIQMDVIVVNLVREGINKHRARELAEHFIQHTTPPQRKPLTDEQIATISVECAIVSPSDIYFARAIEAAHGIKE